MNPPIIALLPAAGMGQRLSPFPCPKELFPVGFQETEVGGRKEKRPKVICQYSLEQMQMAGVRRVVVIVGPKKHDLLSFLGDGTRFGMSFSYLFQEERRGMPYALDLAYPWCRDHTVLFGMPDTILDPPDALAQIVGTHERSGADLTLAAFPTTTPHLFGMLCLDDDDRVRKTIDKPKATDLAYLWGAGCWSPRFSDFLHQTLRSWGRRGSEIVFGDVINAAIEVGCEIRAHVFPRGRYIDIGTTRGLQEALASYALHTGPEDAASRADGSSEQGNFLLDSLLSEAAG